MKYTIHELEAFSIIEQEAELTNYQKRNQKLSEIAIYGKKYKIQTK